MDERAGDDEEILRELAEALAELPPPERAARRARDLFRRWAAPEDADPPGAEGGPA